MFETYEQTCNLDHLRWWVEQWEVVGGNPIRMIGASRDLNCAWAMFFAALDQTNGHVTLRDGARVLASSAMFERGCSPESPRWMLRKKAIAMEPPADYSMSNTGPKRGRSRRRRR